MESSSHRGSSYRKLTVILAQPAKLSKIDSGGGLFSIKSAQLISNKKHSSTEAVSRFR